LRRSRDLEPPPLEEPGGRAEDEVGAEEREGEGLVLRGLELAMLSTEESFLLGELEAEGVVNCRRLGRDGDGAEERAAGVEGGGVVSVSPVGFVVSGKAESEAGEGMAPGTVVVVVPLL
jgi:hypothetical protein